MEKKLLLREQPYYLGRERACESETHAEAQETQERPYDNHPTTPAQHDLQERNGPVFTANRSKTWGLELGYTVSKSLAQLQ